MPRTVTYNGVQYALPSPGDPNWHTSLNAFLSAVVAPETIELTDPDVAPEPVPGKVILRSSGTRLEVSEDGADFRPIGSSSSAEYDIRDLASGVGEGNETADTDALQAAAVLSSSGADVKIKFPIIDLELAEEITITQSLAGCFTWEGINGRASGGTGTRIQWVGADAGTMIHVLGASGSTFKDMCIWGGSTGNRARFGMWIESNQRAGGAGSSNCFFERMAFTLCGHWGAGMVVGDEGRSTLALSGVTGDFIEGELILDLTRDGNAEVMTWNGTDELYVAKQIGTSFTTPGTTIIGRTSGATATVDGATADPDYQANRQASEYVWRDCMFGGTQIVTGDAACWAGWLALGTNNNKDYLLENCRFDGTRYGVEGGNSGYLSIINPTGGNVGHEGKGYLFRLGGNAEIKNGNFENGGEDYRCGLLFLGANAVCTWDDGDWFAKLPDNETHIITAGALSMRGVKIGGSDDDITEAQIQFTAGSLKLENVGWREDFQGYLPIIDGSGNALGLQPGISDYARSVTTTNIIATGCYANANSTPIRELPDLYSKPISPVYNQLWENDTYDRTTLVRRGFARSVEVHDITYAHVLAEGLVFDWRMAPARSKVSEIWAEVTAAFTGGAIATSTVKIGDEDDDDEYTLVKSCFTTTTIGLVDTELGDGLVKANGGGDLIPTGGHKYIAQKYLRVTFAFTGATYAALTAGNLRIYVTFEKY